MDAVCARRIGLLFDKGLSLSLVAILLHTMDQRPLIKTRARARTHTDKSAAQIAPCHRRIRNENRPLHGDAPIV